MAEVKLQTPFDEIHGAIEKHGIISRQKKYRDERGRIIHRGKQEAYAVRHPRDFKKDPPKGEELKHHNRWKEACHRTTQILQAVQPNGLTDQQQFHRQINKIPDYYTPEEALQLYTDFKTRYEKQLPNVRGKHPDPQAPIDKNTGKPKRYLQLPAFIRAMLYQELKIRRVIYQALKSSPNSR